VTPAVASSRVFLLSPAHCGGERARLLLSEDARFDLARRLRTPPGVPLGEAFAFLSGLYFRGKLAYALAFTRPPARCDGVLVITPTDGILPAHARVNLEGLRRFGSVDIDAADARYRAPLLRDAERIGRRVGPCGEVVLLGSVATGKYVDVLAPVLGDRLRFPAEFVGRGDMSRGGLLLRCVAEGRELGYIPLAGAARHGPRPPRLPRA
jgi:hypothetical protein